MWVTYSNGAQTMSLLIKTTGYMEVIKCDLYRGKTHKYSQLLILHELGPDIFLMYQHYVWMSEDPEFI